MDSKRVLVTAFFRDPVPAGFGGTTRGCNHSLTFPTFPVYPSIHLATTAPAEKYRQDGVEILQRVTPQELPRRRRQSTAVFVRERRFVLLARRKHYKPGG